MRKLITMGAAALAVSVLPAVAVIALLGVAGTTIACAPAARIGVGSLLASAPVPVAARAWVATTHTACPALPEPWIAAVMAQESGFQPDAYADDRNGGTWGLFQINASIWRHVYGAAWSADRNRDGVWDVREPEIHAEVGGRYLCGRLDGVRRLRAEHPDWSSTRELTELDALVIAHNAGETRLATYPAIPAITTAFIDTVRARTAAWSAQSDTSPNPEAVTGNCPGDPRSVTSAAVPAGTPVDVASAIRTSLSYVGTRTGWSRMCDRLACRAYGFANSGYASAAEHWAAMAAAGHAHPLDRCPPVGSFMFWATGTPLGHVALVVENDGTCDPKRIKVVSNDVLDPVTGNDGGVYLVTLRQIETGYVRADRYLGWTLPVCAGDLLPVRGSDPRRR